MPDALPPAFLDAPNKITLWLPAITRAANLVERVKFHIDGVEQEIAAIYEKGLYFGSDDLDRTKVVVVGTLQHLYGGRDWSPNDDSLRMLQVGENLFEISIQAPAGEYEYKIAVGGHWGLNYGEGLRPNGSNIHLKVPEGGALVRIRADFSRLRLMDSLNNPHCVHPPTSAMISPHEPLENGGANVFEIQLAGPLSLEDLCKELFVEINQEETRRVVIRRAMDHEGFWYQGDDLGFTYTPERTVFKSWSPVSRSATLRLYDDANGPAKQIVDMRLKANVWVAEVIGDLDGTYYDFVFESYGEKRTAADIHGRAASEDASRSMIVDLAKLTPAGFGTNRPVAVPPQDLVIYEVHVRDFTIDPSSGVEKNWRGKYLGMVQSGTTVPGTDIPTGLDHLRKLGVNALQILPVQMFNPSHRDDYNWGYETTLFNCPELRYATNPSDPRVAITELKKMIQGLHEAGIRVILDVVYNHTVPVSGEGSAFWQTVPYFFFRTDDRGAQMDESGVGNSFDDERPFVRKYIRDSVVHWTRDYCVDGYRFDLLGMFSPESVADWRSALDNERPGVVVYGEPWTGGGPIRLWKGAQRDMGVGVFNDHFRNAVRGDVDGYDAGFAFGAGYADRVLAGLYGSIDDFASTASEVVNYASCHDNLTMWDKVYRVMGDAPEEMKGDVVKLAAGLTLFAQGIPFLEGGIEIGRTKHGHPNSYNAGDSFNRFDWERGSHYQHVNAFIRDAIALRLQHPMFRLNSADEIRAVQSVLVHDAHLIVLHLLGDQPGELWSEALVVFHAGSEMSRVQLPPGDWHFALNGTGQVREYTTVNRTCKVHPRSAMILYRS
ncbi:MAG: type I pullulanase [Armatimonadetes bacterium]|nr:type I pullulanase [Armatimonadota bacterium]